MKTKEEYPEDFICGIIGLARYLNTSKDTARKLAKTLPQYRFGKKIVRFRKTDVLENIAKNQTN